MFIKTHAILDAFCEMNIEQLEKLLDDDRIYQDVKKSLFLKKLRLVFDELGSKGEKRLDMCSGTCGSKECNFGCSGYLFKSPISGKYLSLIFEELKDGDDFQDIYQCYEFKLNAGTVESDNSIRLFFYSDEKAKFRPSQVYLEKMEQCESAMAEMNIGGTDDIVISKSGLLQWLEKYKKTRAGFEVPPLFYETFQIFYDLYNNMKVAGEYLSHEDEAREAVEEINIDWGNDDEQLIEWLIKYENLGSQIYLFKCEYFNETDLEPIPEYIVPDKDYPHIKIESKEFKSIIQFIPFFKEHYNRMRLKFGYDPKNESIYDNNGDEISEEEKNSRLLAFLVPESRKTKAQTGAEFDLN